MAQPENHSELPIIPDREVGIENDPLAGDPIYELFRAHERSYEKLADELRQEGYVINEMQDIMMLIQISGRLPLTREPFFFHGKRSTLSLDIGRPDTEEQDPERKWVVWNKQKFLDREGQAQDTFDLGDDEDDEEWEPDAEVMDLMPAEVIDIFRQLVSEYRQSTSVEGEFRVLEMGG